MGHGTCSAHSSASLVATTLVVLEVVPMVAAVQVMRGIVVLVVTVVVMELVVRVGIATLAGVLVNLFLLVVVLSEYP